MLSSLIESAECRGVISMAILVTGADFQVLLVQLTALYHLLEMCVNNDLVQ